MKRFLIVEDEERFTQVYDLLIRSNYDNIHISFASNGKEALEKALESDYTVILTDVKMPVIDGVEFHKRLKLERPDTARKIAFISGAYSTYVEEEKLPFLLKPFNEDELCEFIDCILEQ